MDRNLAESNKNCSRELQIASDRHRRSNHLRVVASSEGAKLPSILSDSEGRKALQQLTQELVDVLIEMMDLVDGDHDVEPNGDEFEDDDGV